MSLNGNDSGSGKEQTPQPFKSMTERRGKYKLIREFDSNRPGQNGERTTRRYAHRGVTVEKENKKKKKQTKHKLNILLTPHYGHRTTAKSNRYENPRDGRQTALGRGTTRKRTRHRDCCDRETQRRTAPTAAVTANSIEQVVRE